MERTTVGGSSDVDAARGYAAWSMERSEGWEEQGVQHASAEREECKLRDC